ncbi:MAG: type VI secretion system tip protein TssI/VgrG, partial [Pyrinomonadaceae bacterium]
MATTQDGRELSITTPLGKDFLLLQSLQASENLSQLFRYELELYHEEIKEGYEPTSVDEQKILGNTITIRLEQGDGIERFFNGIVVRFSQGQRDDRFSHYQATVVPQIWILTQVSQSRIFQHISVPDILRKVFQGFEVSYEIQGDFPPRNYCVQYRESDWDFASRLMEEEGIFYYFEHTKGKHTLVVANTPQSHQDCPGKSEIAFALETSSETKFTSAVSGWFVEHSLRTGKYTLWDAHFQLPKKNLEAAQPSRFNIGGNKDLEIYDFPGGYARKQDGIDKGGGEQAGDLQKIFDDNRNTAQIRMQEIDVQYKTISGTSDCASFTAGQRFKLINHPAEDNNIQHILVNVIHEITQSPTYETNDPVRAYTNSFTCIPYGGNNAPYRPPRVTPKPTVKGGQTAFVVGPAGEEIFTDKYGRVKVQFNWDRESQADANSSCWVRVAQAWAANKWGMMFIPRIGMEVVINFLEGDPDQPIITGCVYNAEAMPPYTLPDEKTKSTMKSDSSTGGGGFNELRFEDKKGSEQIFIHAEKDVDMRVKNDER